MRKSFAAAGCAVLLSMSAFALDAPPAASPGVQPATMPRALARQVVDKTVGLVESKGVYPRQPLEYTQAKAELLALLDERNGLGGDIDRNVLYARVRKLLYTLDADGHSMLIPAGAQLDGWQSAKAAAPAPEFVLVTTGRGLVLHWTPPAIMGGEALYPGYLKRFYDDAAAHPELARACALVVDLSEQTGGNASPPAFVMHDLFSEANRARGVDRAGGRIPLITLPYLDAQNRKYGGAGRANPLTPFASGPLAVVVSERTSSAGEMLLLALMGEDRVQTFGRTSQGLSTGNMTYLLPDGSNLVLTELRYALGDGPVYHGGIAPMHPAPAGETWDASVKAAAEWAAAGSPRCKAAQPAVAQAE
jgi:hypothetical protein